MVLLVPLIVVCSRGEIDPQRPPPLPHSASELSHNDPTAEWLKENPRPEPGMIGCFSVPRRNRGRGEPRLPATIQLTNEVQPSNLGRVQTFYQVHSLDEGVPARLWSWLPLAGSRARVELSDGSEGWVFDLRQSTAGFEGTAHAFRDAGPFNLESIPIVLTKVPCE